jgi:hypothetical protein
MQEINHGDKTAVGGSYILFYYFITFSLHLPNKQAQTKKTTQWYKTGTI